MKGVYPAVLTPLREDLSIDCEELAWHCLDLMKRGCHGIALFGTTGEGPSFSVSERISALEKIVSMGIDPKKIILGNGASAIADTVALARGSLKCGCNDLLICPPSFYKNISEEGVIAYYREVIQRIGDPTVRVLLYHIPQMSGIPITVPIIKALRREFPQIVVGMKESEGNFALTKAVLSQCPGFQVFVARELQICEGMKLGCAGTICGIANLFPELIRALYDQKPDPATEKLTSFFHSIEGKPFVPVIKAEMEKKRGPRWHAVYPPLVPFNIDQEMIV
jgi:4-hydroxy-tetrahydrodipicolinate synthase